MKLSFTTMACPGRGVEGAALLARRFGFEGVDLRLSDHLGEIPAKPDACKLREARQVLADYGLELAGLLCYNQAPPASCGDWSLFAGEVQTLLDIGEALGALSVRIFGGNPAAENRPQDYVARFADTLLPILRSRGSPVQLRLQHHQGSFNYPLAADLARRMSCKSAGCAGDHAAAPEPFGLVFSPDHCFLMGDDLQLALGSAPFLSGQLYLSDLGPGHNPELRPWDAVLPGRGQVPLAECVEAFRAAGFGGYLTFKWEKIWQDHLCVAEEALGYFVDWIKTI